MTEQQAIRNRRNINRPLYLPLRWKRAAASFPWRTASHSFAWQVGGLALGLIVVIYSLRQTVYSQVLSGVPPAKILADFDFELSWLVTVVAVAGVIWIGIFNYISFRPLGRLLRLTSRRRQELATVDADAFQDEPGEWFELERSVNKMVRGIQKRESLLLREREELITILGSVNEGIVAMGLNTEPLYFNSRFAVLFGAGTVGESSPALRERFRSPELLAGFSRVLDERTTRTFPAKLRTEIHETERDFMVSVSPLLARQGLDGEEGLKSYGAVAVFHDITELKKTEQMRMDFVANASHELKTPLTSIKGYLATAIDDLKAKRFDDAEKFLETVDRNVDRLIHLVHDLLDLATLESGTEVKKQRLDTEEITRAAINVVEGRKQKRGVIRTKCDTSYVLGDSARIEQVLVNLIDNAVKYAPEGSEVLVTWEAGTGSKDGETILRVRDSGAGVTEEHLPRLFERFYRVDSGRAREVGGTGLGLAIVKHIVLAHGGSIAVKSRPGEGSEFICRFPNR